MENTGVWFISGYICSTSRSLERTELLEITQRWRWQAVPLALPPLIKQAFFTLLLTCSGVLFYGNRLTVRWITEDKTWHIFYSIVCPERSQNYKVLELYIILPSGEMQLLQGRHRAAVQPNELAPDKYLGSHTRAATEMCQGYGTVFVVSILLLLQVGLISLSALLTTKKSLKGKVNSSINYLNTFRWDWS